MSTPKSNQLSVRTAGSANLVSILGDIISSDGIEALRVPLGLPGQFFGVDLTQECGVGWLTPGGGGALTFSDGVTRTLDNVTNDLVTGTPVAQLDVEVPFVNDNATIQAQLGGAILIKSGDDGTRQNVGIVGGTVNIQCELGDLNMIVANGVVAITAGDGMTVVAGADYNTTVTGEFLVDVTAGDLTLRTNGAADIIVDGGGDVTITGEGNGASNGDVTITANPGTGTAILTGGTTIIGGVNAINVNPDNGASVTITTGTTGDMVFNLSRDELHTVGRNFSLNAAGASGISINATHDTSGSVNISSEDVNVNISAGAGDGAGAVRIQNGTTSATRLFQIFNGVGSGQQNGNISPAGGTVIDSQARVAINTILDYLFNWGWVSNPAP